MLWHCDSRATVAGVAYLLESPENPQEFGCLKLSLPAVAQCRAQLAFPDQSVQRLTVFPDQFCSVRNTQLSHRNPVMRLSSCMYWIDQPVVIPAAPSFYNE